MMEPIIQTIVTQMNAQFEEDCLKVVNSYGFNVNKERLMQALTDARKFYDEGKRDAVRHGRWVKIAGMAPPEYHDKHRCSLCYARALERKHHEELSDYCPNCGAKMDGDEQ